MCRVKVILKSAFIPLKCALVRELDTRVCLQNLLTDTNHWKQIKSLAEQQ